MAKRKVISKKLRFDVFKRDGFTCQYCGRTPPEVILEIDHIIPVSKKGTNDINNLITACFDCNRGKKDKSLDTIPSGISINIKQLKEKELQLKEYNLFLKRIDKRIMLQAKKINKIFTAYFPEKRLTEKFMRNGLKRFLKQLPFVEIEEAMENACYRVFNDPNGAIKYFCGICWNKIKKDKGSNTETEK